MMMLQADRVHDSTAWCSLLVAFHSFAARRVAAAVFSPFLASSGSLLFLYLLGLACACQASDPEHPHEILVMVQAVHKRPGETPCEARAFLDLSLSAGSLAMVLRWTSIVVP